MFELYKVDLTADEDEEDSEFLGNFETFDLAQKFAKSLTMWGIDWEIFPGKTNPAALGFCGPAPDTMFQIDEVTRKTAE